MAKRPEPIRIGDKFQTKQGVLEVIFTRPGGHVELIDRARTTFHNRYTRELRDLPRVV